MIILRLVGCLTKEKWSDYGWINSLSFIPRSTTCHSRKINDSHISDHDVTEINNVIFLPGDRHNNTICRKAENCNKNSISRWIDELWKDSVNVRQLIVIGKSYRTHPWASFDDAKNLWASCLQSHTGAGGSQAGGMGSDGNVTNSLMMSTVSCGRKRQSDTKKVCKATKMRLEQARSELTNTHLHD